MRIVIARHQEGIKMRRGPCMRSGRRATGGGSGITPFRQHTAKRKRRCALPTGTRDFILSRGRQGASQPCSIYWAKRTARY